MNVIVVKSFTTITKSYLEGQIIDLPKGTDWVKSGLVKRTKRKIKEAE